MQLFDRDNPPEIPESVAVCPICGAPIVIQDIDAWESETGRVTEDGFKIDCSTEPDEDDNEDDWDDFLSSHWSMPYVDWLPLTMRVYKWFDSNYRLRLEGADV